MIRESIMIIVFLEIFSFSLYRGGDDDEKFVLVRKRLIKYVCARAFALRNSLHVFGTAVVYFFHESGKLVHEKY